MKGALLVLFLVLFLAGAGAVCGGNSNPPDKYVTGTLSDSGPWPCIRVPIASPGGNPACTVVEELADGGSTTVVMVPSCVESLDVGPCWTVASTMQATCTGLTVLINEGGSAVTPAPGVTYSYSCLLCSSSSPPPPGC
jgi:hypothetical protein